MHSYSMRSSNSFSAFECSSKTILLGIRCSLHLKLEAVLKTNIYLCMDFFDFPKGFIDFMEIDYHY